MKKQILKSLLFSLLIIATSVTSYADNNFDKTRPIVINKDVSMCEGEFGVGSVPVSSNGGYYRFP